jgi:catechol 2,3-dioxygenase-like lactoylglutathione lyase family enzyme
MRTSPLAISTLGVESLDSSLAFYRDVLGLEATEPVTWSGADFERHWQLPARSSARAALLRYPGSDIGRILLCEFDADRREQIRPNGERQFIGLWNLNFYTHDIRRAARELAAKGVTPWTEPTFYEVGEAEGAPTEVILEGPDGVIFNLVEPQGPPETLVGSVRAYLDERGSTPTDYTEVVTSAHHVASMDDALGFYIGRLGLEKWLDAIFDKEESNHFLSLPRDGRSRIVFLKGDNLFGKIALMEPQNFELPSFVSRAVPPNIGYLAMGFEVSDVDALAEDLRGAGIEEFSPLTDVELPGIGRRRATIVRTPGSGALTQLVQAP